MFLHIPRSFHQHTHSHLKGIKSAYLHCRISIPISDCNQMVILQCAELFTLQGVRFRYPSQVLSTGKALQFGSESESASVNVK